MREFNIHTDDWAIVKFRYSEKAMGWKGDVFHSRPGSSAKEAWVNATETAKISKKEFMAAGWCAQRLIITGRSK